MLGDHTFLAPYWMSKLVLAWALDHLDFVSLSAERMFDLSQLLRFGALYVPSEHVVSSEGIEQWTVSTGCVEVHGS
jgi:hypothetical protein